MLALIRAVVLSKNQLQRRAFHLTAQKKIKEIVINENKDKNEIIIEGKYLDEVELTKTEILRFPEDDHKTKCAFCKLEKQGVYVQYTDTLVLRQFLREDGTILPKKVTGLCKKQQSKLHTIVKHAKAAGLLMNLQPPLLNGSLPSLDQEKRNEHLKWNNAYENYEKLRRTKKYI